MLSVLIPTHNSENSLAQMLPPLVRHAVSGLVSEVMIIDAGSDDATRRVADMAGCTVIDAREADLPDLVASVRGAWLLVLDPGTQLVGDWPEAIEAHIGSPTGAAGAARFRVARDPNAPWWRPWPGAGKGPFARGFLISKAQAVTLARPGMALADLPRGVAVRTLAACLTPPASR